MKVSQKKNGLCIEVTLNIAAADYAEIERKKLADCRRKADFKGFRKGNVPMSLVQKVYGPQVLAEAVNAVIGEQLDKFVKDNRLNILGEPLPSENQKEVDWTDGADFEFVFDVAPSPEVMFEVEKSDTVNSYDITVADKEKKSMVESLKKYYTEKKEEKSDEDILKEVEERFAANMKQESEWRLSKDIRDFYVNKAGIKLPEDFLKRWLIYANEGKISKEDIEKEFAGFVEDFKWQLVRGYLFKKYELKIEQKDIEEAAKAFVTYQYAMYGLGNVPEDMIAEAVKNVLNDQNQISRLAEQVEDTKVMDKIKETITVKTKKITSEKFRELK